MQLGIDLGAAQIKLVLCDERARPLHQASRETRGRPLATLVQLLEDLHQASDAGRQVRVAITGDGRGLVEHLIPCLGVNEVVATACGVRAACPDVRTVIDLGGQFSKWILVGTEPGPSGAVLDFASNGLCAAGAGAFLAQQADRLGLTVDDLGRIAARAPRGATIAGRCSVFAKSDMIHLQQKGTPVDEIAFGLCQALARTFAATIAQGRRTEPPVALVGGGAVNPGLVRAFREALHLGDGALIVPPAALFFGALGAARLAEDGTPIELDRLIHALRQRIEDDLRRRPDGTSALAPLERPPREDEAPSDEDPAPVEGPVEAFLGVDVGSVSTNLVLLGPEREVLQGIYLPTRGRPVDVVQEGLDRIRERFGERLRILGVGATGSGRHLAAELIGADAVHNEITAQMTASIACAPEVDTIFEIGGQDSKYIAVRDGRLADFEMNKICAGGTGSFLEEQAGRLGISIYDEFADLAFRSLRPYDLGARCTVFMDSELIKAQERGAPLADICAGLAYSVARNYLEKVVAGRSIGTRVLFQGGTASNAAVVGAFRNLLGRPVRVHPYNRISGAIGAALLASRARSGRSRFRGFSSCAAPVVRSFECRHCENRCQVNRVRVGERVAHFGDVCERYTQGDRDGAARARPFPDLFDARDRLLEAAIATRADEAPGRPRIGLLRASLNLEYLPFWVVLLRELGYEAVVSAPTTARVLQEHGHGVPAEVCLPIRAAVAQARALLHGGEVDRLFVPALVECPPRDKADQTHTCFYAQQLPDMLRAHLGARVVSAQFALGEGRVGLVEPTLALAEALGRPLLTVARAMARAHAAQQTYTAERRRLGREAIRATFDRAVVVLGRPYNTHDPLLNLTLARRLDRLGLPAIPWDLLPLGDVELDPRWHTVPWHFSREQLRAIEIVRRDPRLFPILVSSYGCGPDGFTVKHVGSLLADRPRLLLEFDEHCGEAGLVTRLEAFADEIDTHLQRREGQRGTPALTPGPRDRPAGHRFFLPHFGEHARIYAAALRSAGIAAEVLPPPDAATIRLGEAHASGRECHPYAILAGELVRVVQETLPQQGDVFFFPNCTAPCLLRQYGDSFRLLLQSLGSPPLEVWEANTSQLGHFLGVPGLIRLYEGLLVTDVLMTLATRLRPYERERGAIDRVLRESLERTARAVAARTRLDEVVAAAAQTICAVPREGRPGERPVVGITGDLYTRMNAAGNADLVCRLEAMGCEVWLSPFFSTMADIAYVLELPQLAERGRLKDAALGGLAIALGSGVRWRLLRRVPPEVVGWAVEPPVEELIGLARRYVGSRSNHLILTTAAKIADFLRRGASGAINAAGLNCMVGTAVAALIPAIRADFGQAPVLTLVYGGTEGPAQRIRLETFVHQVHARWRRDAA